MQFAIIQKTSAEVDRAAMVRAFASVSSLTATDARMLANDDFGVLVEFLSERDAGTLCRAMLAEGIGCEIVQQDLLPELVGPRRLRRGVAREGGLATFDLYGRESVIPWGSVYMIAAGAVTLAVSTDKVFTRTESLDTGGLGPQLVRSRSLVPTTEHQERYLLELYVNTVPERYRITADAFSYNDRGDNELRHWRDCFIDLATEAISRAGQAALNTGALTIGAGLSGIKTYPSEHSFEEEIKWIMLRTRGSSRMRHD